MPTRVELAAAVEAADLGSRAGRVVAVRALLVGLLEGLVTAAEARAGAALLSVASSDDPIVRQDDGLSLVAGLLAVARRSREELALREAPVLEARPDPWARLVLEVPADADPTEQRQRHDARQGG